MKKLRFIPAVVIVATALSCAAADEQQTPTDAFRGQTQYHKLMCQLKEKIAANKAELGEPATTGETDDCIKNAKAEAKKSFGPALKAVSKNKEAAKLLKDYYAAWLTAINGVIPNVSERKLEYERRQAAAEAAYDAIWNRFEVEAGLQ